MDPLKQIVWLLLAITFLIFLAFFGRLPALRHTPIGALYRLLWVQLPHLLSAADQRLASGRLTRSSSWLYRRAVHERHPAIVIFFLAIMAVSEYLFLPQAWPRLGWAMRATTAAAVAMPYVFLGIACGADPGYITAANHAYHMALYPYDHANFHPGNECRTCGLLKPARSKHCDLCKRCVARADHHCVFINSCVGYGNHAAFLLLLASTALLASYGGLLGLSLLAADTRRLFPGWAPWRWPPPAGTFGDDNSDGGGGLRGYLAGWAWGLQGNMRLGAATLLALLISPLVWGLLLYSLFLVYCGTTTNESMKWSDYGEEMADGFAYRRALPADRALDPRFEPRCERWPARAEHVMLTTQDGRAPAVDDADLLGVGEWERVRHLRDVDNLYDRGFWHNLCDVFVRDFDFGGIRIDR